MNERLAQFQAEMVNIARDLGLDPNPSNGDPQYYGDMIGEAILNLQKEKSIAEKKSTLSKEVALEYATMLKQRYDILTDENRKDYFKADDIAAAICDDFDEAIARQAEAEGWYAEYAKLMDVPDDHPLMKTYGKADAHDSASREQIVVTGARTSYVDLDPKGHVVLERNGDDALVFLGSHAPTPYVIAHGYDDATGGWSYGTYFSDVAEAKDAFDPEIIEDMTVRWSREGLREEMRHLGYDVDSPEGKRAIEVVAEQIGSYFYDRMSESGSEYVFDEICNVANELGLQKSAPSLKTVSEQVKESAQAIDARNRPIEGDAR